MVDILDVFYALIGELKKCIPTAKHYVGKLPENFKLPSFLYLLIFNADMQSNYFTKDTTLDLQIIYFATEDGYGVVSFDDKLQTMGKLKEFLSRFNLQVKDRNLKFTYSFGEADEQLAINIQFKFKDGVVNLTYDEEQAREMIEKINISDKEMIEWDFPIS